MGGVFVTTIGSVLKLRAAGVAGQRLAARLDSSPNYVVVGLGTGQRTLAETRAMHAVAFRSLDALTARLAPGGLDASVHAVIYDNEAWPQTPVAEQLAPERYIPMAAVAAHASGYTFICTPGMDLVPKLGQRAGETRPAAYLRLGLAGLAAKDANVIDIQAQSLGGNPQAYASFVAAAARQARAANPHVLILAGLSTNPMFHVTAQTLADSARAVRSSVNGYWLTVSGPPGADAPALAVGFAGLAGL